ncbi:MAG: hypothetical protein KBE04_01835 [Phycisphaerae bacterium]|nr:hypothetical protein [Phycisphaerae bacterium]
MPDTFRSVQLSGPSEFSVLSSVFSGVCIASVTALILLSTVSAFGQDVTLNWLDGPPPLPVGVSFGVPWAKGQVPRDQAFTLKDAEGKALPVQTWPLALWADGSLKWSGLATVAQPDTAGPFKLTLAQGKAPDAAVQVRQAAAVIEVSTGPLQCRIPRTGKDLVESMTVDGRVVARQGRLECILQEGPDLDAARPQARARFISEIRQTAVEQSGPVRAVVMLSGVHRAVEGGREWLPFHVRLYFYAGRQEVRMVHTIVYDGDEHKDFIRGLGVTFAVPMREQVQNRHVRFSGQDGGLWSEPIQPLKGRDGRFIQDPNTRADVYTDQIAGARVPNKEQVDPRVRNLLSMWAVWDDFRLIQPNANGFTIEKRANPQSCWLAAGAGKRASGLVFAGDVSGGLAVGVKDFWQSYPSSLEVCRASSDVAQVRAWLWSPDAPAMDLRHYDTRAHGLEEAYEDVQEGLSTPHGIARTSELTLFATAGVPGKEAAVHMAQASAQPPLLVCSPQTLRAAQAFGIWGLVDRSTPAKQAIEDRLQATLDYYVRQVDQRNWYGFWDYGDVMHSYDYNRHVWRYDLGGMAWDNSELGTDMWLWTSFLRTGRPDVFRMAEAMTRHTGEVDCYHLGRLAGLGSRHNVRHWGCGAKEARISQAAYRRYHYYLTTDERTGDQMREMLNADLKTVEFDPMRLAQPITEAEKKVAPTRVRLGPDWLAFAGNWMTEWERTGDTRWRDKILAGVESLSKMPFGMRTGRNLVLGYDPATGRLYPLVEEPGQYNLATIMGGAEVAFELSLMLDDPRWHRLWLQYCRLYNAPRDLLVQDMTTGTEGMDGRYVRDGRLAGWVFYKTGAEAFKQAAVNTLVGRGRGPQFGMRGGADRRIEGPDSLNPVNESGMANTNNAAQDGLETVAMLGLVGEFLPAEMPAQTEGPMAPFGRRGRGARGTQPPPTGPSGTPRTP